MMHIYAFGSVCRGEVDNGSDVDLLACVDEAAPELDHRKYSIYRYPRLRALWAEGNPFAWHLHLEARLIFSGDGSDFLREIGAPQPYVAAESDYAKFQDLFMQSWNELERGANSATFHLSCMFLALRNFATCHSLAQGQPIFSRRSPLLISPALPMRSKDFATLTRARLLSTRGHGDRLTVEDIRTVLKAAAVVPPWMNTLRSLHERI
jgi:hypothetical protein